MRVLEARKVTDLEQPYLPGLEKPIHAPLKPYYQKEEMSYVNSVFYGRDCTVMREIPNESVQCVVTSPPYFGLRKYEAGTLEIGRESDLKNYIFNLLSVFDEVKRVLQPCLPSQR